MDKIKWHLCAKSYQVNNVKEAVEQLKFAFERECHVYLNRFAEQCSLNVFEEIFVNNPDSELCCRVINFKGFQRKLGEWDEKLDRTMIIWICLENMLTEAFRAIRYRQRHLLDLVYNKTSALQHALLEERFDDAFEVLGSPEYSSMAKKRTVIGKGISDLLAACLIEECPIEIVQILIDKSMSQDREQRFAEYKRCVQMNPSNTFLFLEKDESLLYEDYPNRQKLIHLLVKNCTQDCLSQVLEKYSDKIDLLAETVKGETILHKAGIHKFEDIAMLEPKLAHIPRRYDLKTPLMLLIEQSLFAFKTTGREENFILEYGVDINATDRYGDTAFIYAARRHLLRFMVFLICYGADYNVRAHRKFSVKFHDEADHLDVRDEYQKLYKDALEGNTDLRIFSIVVQALSDTNSEYTFDYLLDFNTLPWSAVCKYKINTLNFYRVLIQYNFVNMGYLLAKILFQIVWTRTFYMVIKEYFVSKLFLQDLFSVTFEEPNPKHTFDLVNITPKRYYKKEEFHMVKYFLDVKTFNRICKGREIVTLKRMCRHVIRKELAARPIRDSDKTIERIDKGFQALGLTKELTEFLKYREP